MLGLSILCAPTTTQAQENSAAPDAFLLLLSGDLHAQDSAFTVIEEHWQPSFVPMALETLYLSRDLGVTGRLVKLLERRTGQALGFDIGRWQEWLWNRPEDRHPHYAEFKQRAYGLIDSRFEAYFTPGRTAAIRLDEVVWGGVRQDGIPPLHDPKMIPASAADYLEDDNVVFGIEVNGDARAYPKRIMAWHELFTDRIGGVPVTGAYCTLCGAMILYRSRHDGILHRLGTSGFLYRSNKLMYDRDTNSLWNTLWGTPVIGPLADREITLERLGIVTTTWAQWRRRHPDTLVLSLETGYQRDYREGVAYFEYFATDELMFTVPRRDTRLPNKDEVLGLILPQHPDQPLAVSARYLYANRLYRDAIGGVEFVILTDPSGANRVYESAGLNFTDWDGDRAVRDTNGDTWTLSEAALTHPDGRTLRRLPAHRAFWFGWFSAYPHTRLVRP